MFRTDQIEVIDLVIQTLQEHERKLDELTYVFERFLDELDAKIAQIPTNQR